jgi:serine/threonine protein kinase
MSTYGYAAPEYIATGIFIVEPTSLGEKKVQLASDISFLLSVLTNHLCRELGHLYVKSDVYSFGVVLLEVLTGRRAIDQKRPTGELSLVDWARPYLAQAERRILHRVMDPRLVGKYPSKAAHQASQLARSCLSHNHMTRPSMNEIVDVLENICSMDTKTREPNNTSLQLKPRGRSLLG